MNMIHLIDDIKPLKLDMKYLIKHVTRHDSHNLLVCDLLHSVWQNHIYVMLLFY